MDWGLPVPAEDSQQMPSSHDVFGCWTAGLRKHRANGAEAPEATRCDATGKAYKGWGKAEELDAMISLGVQNQRKNGLRDD